MEVSFQAKEADGESDRLVRQLMLHFTIQSHRRLALRWWCREVLVELRRMIRAEEITLADDEWMRNTIRAILVQAWPPPLATKGDNTMVVCNELNQWMRLTDTSG